MGSSYRPHQGKNHVHQGNATDFYNDNMKAQADNTRVSKSAGSKRTINESNFGLSSDISDQDMFGSEISPEDVELDIDSNGNIIADVSRGKQFHNTHKKGK